MEMFNQLNQAVGEQVKRIVKQLEKENASKPQWKDPEPF
jgi:hypothetical protein